MDANHIGIASPEDTLIVSDLNIRPANLDRASHAAARLHRIPRGGAGDERGAPQHHPGDPRTRGVRSGCERPTLDARYARAMRGADAGSSDRARRSRPGAGEPARGDDGRARLSRRGRPGFDGETVRRSRVDARDRFPRADPATNSRAELPAALSGRSRCARAVGAEDAARFADWMTAFTREAVPHDRLPEGERLAHAAREGQHLFWVVDGEPVSMAGIVRRTRHTAAIAPVYTPPHLRRRGYAGSVTAAVAELAFAQGKRTACLYTDLRNRFSNRCYAKIGFEPVCDSLHYPRAVTTRLAAEWWWVPCTGSQQRQAPGSELAVEREAEPDGPGLFVCWMRKPPARRLVNLTRIPVVVMAAEASYDQVYDHCTTKYLNQARVKTQCIRLQDKGIQGNGHMVMIEKNNLDIARLIDDWLQSNVR